MNYIAIVFFTLMAGGRDGSVAQYLASVLSELCTSGSACGL